MAIDTTPAGLLEEIRAAEASRDNYLSHFAESVERYHGAYFKENSSAEEDCPENHYFEYLSLTIPKLAYTNPTVRVGTKRAGAQGETARAIGFGLSRWMQDTQFQRVCEKLAVDFGFSWGVALTTLGKKPGGGTRPKGVRGGHGAYQETSDPSDWPQVHRLSQKRFFFDPYAISIEEARYMGHCWVRDKEDLIQEAKDDADMGWNLKAIESVSANSGLDKIREDVNGPDRNEIVAYEIWIPEAQEDEDADESKGYHGTIYTLAVGMETDGHHKPEFIRDPRPYWGPRWGPYTFFGAYDVPDEAVPLSPITAVENQIDDLNDHVRAASESAANYKKIVLVDSTANDLPTKVKDSEGHFVIPVNGLEKERVVEVELGGITQTAVAYIQMARERLDRNSGIHEAQRGVTQGGTATEVAVAERASESRMGFIASKFQTSVVRLLNTVAWYMYHDEEIVFPMGAEAAAEYGIEEPWFMGGTHGEGSGATYDDLELEIEPYSMARTSEALQQQRAMQVLTVVSQVAPMIPQIPWVDWGTVLKSLAESMKVPDLPEMIDIDLALQVAQMQNTFAAQGNDPRLGRHVGEWGVEKAMQGLPKNLNTPGSRMGAGEPNMGGGGPVPTEQSPLGAGMRGMDQALGGNGRARRGAD